MKHEPVSRRDRPAKPLLSRQAIVDVAMRMMRADGLAKVTMRRIAAELDTGPASLYVYVAGVAELHGAMVDELLAELSLPARVRRSSWRSDVVDVLVGVTTILYREPSLAVSVVSLRPSGRRYLALIDWLLQALRKGGVGTRDAGWGVDLLLQHAVATAAEQGTRAQRADADDDMRVLIETIADTDPATYPGLAWVGDDLFSGEGPDRLRWAFERIIVGIARES